MKQGGGGGRKKASCDEDIHRIDQPQVALITRADALVLL